MIKRILLLVLVIILSLPAPILAAQAGNGKIEGRIVNGTAGSSNVTGQDVTLKTYINDAESASATTKTDAEGRFAFAGLVTDTSYNYDVTVTFQEADYQSERLTFTENETTKSLELTVYDSTMSDQAIRLTTAHTIVYSGEGSLQVEEFLLFVNESDRTYIGTGEITATGTRRTLKLPLPAKATDLQLGGDLMECCVLRNEESFFDTMPVYPGSRQISYAYEVDTRSGQYAFSRPVDYSTDSYNLLVQGENVGISADRLTVQQPIQVQGAQFNYLAGDSLAQGDTLAIKLSGLPQSSSQTTVRWTILTLIVLAGGVGIAYLLRKRKLQPVSVEAGSIGRREKLLAELAKLDDDFESGKVSEAVYHRRRAENKAQLVELMQRSKGESGNR